MADWTPLDLNGIRKGVRVGCWHEADHRPYLENDGRSLIALRDKVSPDLPLWPNFQNLATDEEGIPLATGTPKLSYDSADLLNGRPTLKIGDGQSLQAWGLGWRAPGFPIERDTFGGWEYDETGGDFIYDTSFPGPITYDSSQIYNRGHYGIANLFEDHPSGAEPGFSVFALVRFYAPTDPNRIEQLANEDDAWYGYNTDVDIYGDRIMRYPTIIGGGGWFYETNKFPSWEVVSWDPNDPTADIRIRCTDTNSDFLDWHYDAFGPGDFSGAPEGPQDSSILVKPGKWYVLSTRTTPNFANSNGSWWYSYGLDYTLAGARNNSLYLTRHYPYVNLTPLEVAQGNCEIGFTSVREEMENVVITLFGNTTQFKINNDYFPTREMNMRYRVRGNFAAYMVINGALTEEEHLKVVRYLSQSWGAGADTGIGEGYQKTDLNAGGFPDLEPSIRTYTPPSFSNSKQTSVAGVETAVRHSNFSSDALLSLTYRGLSTLEADAVFAHYESQKGSFKGFGLNRGAIRGLDEVDRSLKKALSRHEWAPSGSSWIYESPPVWLNERQGVNQVDVALRLVAEPLNALLTGDPTITVANEAALRWDRYLTGASDIEVQAPDSGIIDWGQIIGEGAATFTVEGPAEFRQTAYGLYGPQDLQVASSDQFLIDRDWIIPAGDIEVQNTKELSADRIIRTEGNEVVVINAANLLRQYPFDGSTDGISVSNEAGLTADRIMQASAPAVTVENQAVLVHDVIINGASAGVTVENLASLEKPAYIIQAGAPDISVENTATFAYGIKFIKNAPKSNEIEVASSDDLIYTP